MDVESHRVEADDGHGLHCWRRSPADATEAVLFVHGIITNARGLFVTPVEEDTSYSWVHAASDRGRAAFAMDQRGYGESDPIPAFEEPPSANDPPVRADQAADDIGAVVKSIRAEYDTVHLVGVSWGCHTTGRYAAREDPPVASLAKVAPVYEPPYDFDVALEALGIENYEVGWFEQDRETVRARSSHDDHVFEAIWHAQTESVQGIDAKTYRVQAGGIADWADSTRGDPVWDPAAVDLPTLVFYGSDDQIADRRGSLACYDALPHEQTAYAELAGVDHYPMHSDRRSEVFDLVNDFQDRVGRS